MNNQKPQKIFEKVTHAGVRQDKGAPGRTYAVLVRPQSAQRPAQERPKHHGSQRRRVVEVSGCVSREVFDRLERLRDQGGQRLSRSAVVADFVTRGVQGYIDMQYGALLEPIIKRTIKGQMTDDTNLWC